jgi:hypothetical protein
MCFSVFPRLALPFPQFALLHSICVQLGLITALGNRGCQFPWCALGLTALTAAVAVVMEEWSTQGFAIVVKTFFEIVIVVTTQRMFRKHLNIVRHGKVPWLQYHTVIGKKL